MIIIKFNYFIIGIRFCNMISEMLCDNNDDVTENSYFLYVLVCRRLPKVIDDIALIR